MASKYVRNRRNKVSWLMERYGDTCWICCRPIEPDRISLDHVIPRSHGGTRHRNNLMLAHKKCNSRRGNGPLPVLTLSAEMAFDRDKFKETAWRIRNERRLAALVPAELAPAG